MRLFFYSSVLICIFTYTHKFYVSVNQVFFNSEKNRVEITNRIFIDDLNTALQSLQNSKFEIEDMTKTSESYKIFYDYYQSNFTVKINDKKSIIIVKSFEIEEDVFVIYALIDKVSKIKSFEMENNLLFDLFASQQHINHIEINNAKTSTLLDNQNRKTLLKF